MKTTLIAAISLSVGLCTGFFVFGNARSDPPVLAGPACGGAVIASIPEPAPMPRMLPMFTRPSLQTEEPIADAREDNTLEAHGEHARHLFGLLTERLRSSPMGDHPNPEVVGRSQAEFIQGMAHALKSASPETLPHLARELENKLCEQGATDAEIMMYSYLQMDLPETASSRGFECVLAKRGGREDVVTWTLLDAWQSSGLDPTPSMLALGSHAKDARTTERLVVSPPQGLPGMEQVEQ
ncbi:MAG: hypothetical protein KA712_06730 [Myxococcales bacterium]|nr:hypothetical protein [Myxococcales bacterium]